MVTELTVPGDLMGARRVQELLDEALRTSTRTEADIFTTKLAVEEALVYAIKHDNQMDPDKRIHIAFDATAERFEVRITAEGSDITRTVSAPPPTA